MFGDNKDVLTIVKNQEESHGKMLLEMGRVGNALVNIEKMLSKTVASYTEENIVLQTYDMPFQANGYLYNTLIVGDSTISDNAKLIVTKGGVSFTIPLVAGDNAVNIPDGSNIHVTTTSGNAVTAILLRYNTPGNNDTNVSLVGSLPAGTNNIGAIALKDAAYNNLYGVGVTGDAISSSALAIGGYAYNNTNWDRLRTVQHLPSGGYNGLGILGSSLLKWNGASYDADFNNSQGTLLASAARTSGVVGTVQTNYNAKGIAVFLNVTAASGTGGLTVKICAYDNTSGQYNQINSTPTAVTANGVYIYLLYPGISGGGVAQATSLALSRQWLVNVAAGDSTSYTYSAGYSLIL